MELSEISSFKSLARQIEPDTKYGIILLQERSTRVNADLAIKSLSEMIPSKIDYKILCQEFPAILLIWINPEFMREALLMLTAKGFITLKAYNPIT